MKTTKDLKASITEVVWVVQVLQEPGVSKDVLKARAKGLKKLGAIFEVTSSPIIPLSCQMEKRFDKLPLIWQIQSDFDPSKELPRLQSGAPPKLPQDESLTTCTLYSI